jgi:hypothetical protein
LKGRDAVAGLHIGLSLHVADLVPGSAITKHLARFAQGVCSVDATTSVFYLSLLRDSSERHHSIAELAIFAPTGRSLFVPVRVQPSVTRFESYLDQIKDTNSGVLEEEVRPKDLRSPVSRLLGAEEERAIIALAGHLAEEACSDDDARHFYRLAED